MSSRKQTHWQITPLNAPELAGRRKQRELAGERPPEDQAAYLDRSEVDAAEPLTDTAFDEGELPAGAVAAPLDAADLSDSEDLERLARCRTMYILSCMPVRACARTIER